MVIRPVSFQVNIGKSDIEIMHWIGIYRRENLFIHQIHTLSFTSIVAISESGGKRFSPSIILLR